MTQLVFLMLYILQKFLADDICVFKYISLICGVLLKVFCLENKLFSYFKRFNTFSGAE